MNRSIWIGFDSRETAAFAVTVNSIRKHLSQPIPIRGLVLRDLIRDQLYRRPTEITRSPETGALLMIDKLSMRPDYNGAMSTEFAISRFLVPRLANGGWALFMDCDMLVRTDLASIFAFADPTKAVMCVKHNYVPTDKTKMDGQVQTVYPRKNWSSVMLFNCDHPANRRLNDEVFNTVPGRDLHAFCWLADDEIGELPPHYNWLAGEQAFPGEGEPLIVHHTLGSPCMRGYEDTDFAEDWRAELAQWGRSP
jgi:lipopolysaccharide biosynthesis glycosyltransferase